MLLEVGELDGGAERELPAAREVDRLGDFGLRDEIGVPLRYQP